MTLPDFLTEWPYGEIMLTGHRIALYHVIVYRQMGYSAEQLLDQFPTLPLAKINQVLDFYEANRTEVDEYVQGRQAIIDEMRAAFVPKASPEELVRRVEERKRKEGR